MKRAYRTSRSTRCRVCWGLAVLLFFSVTAGVSAAEPSAELSLKDQAEAYFSTHDYDGFYKYLSRLLADDPMNAGAHFYRALTRVEEIAYWQKIKDWQGVYDTAPAYQKGIAADLDAAEKYAGEDVTVRFGVALLRWRAANEARKEGAYALFDAVVAAAEKAASVPQGLAMVRDVADELRGFEDKNLSRRLDRIYVDNLGASGATSEELIRQADAFLKEDNLYLAKSLFEITLGRIGDDLVRARAMVAIADRFASSGSVPAADPVFAEELYVKAAALKGAEAFDNDSLYRRAFNLERLRDYAAALPVYKQWLAAYGAADPGRRADVLFRVGVLSAYGLRDRAAGERVLEELIKDFPATALAVAARYELGCMAQWSGDRDTAASYFDVARKEAIDIGFSADDEEVALLDARTAELKEDKPQAYALRLFFEGTFRQDATEPGRLMVDVTGRPARAPQGAAVRYVVTTSNPSTGCMTPDFSYEWSGATGSAANLPNSPELDTSYKKAGINVVHCAVMDAAGLEGVGFDIVQVMPEDGR